LIAAEQQSSGITETPRSKTETPLTRPAAAATTTLAHTESFQAPKKSAHENWPSERK